MNILTAVGVSIHGFQETPKIFVTPLKLHGSINNKFCKTCTSALSIAIYGLEIPHMFILYSAQ